MKITPSYVYASLGAALVAALGTSAFIYRRGQREVAEADLRAAKAMAKVEELTGKAVDMKTKAEASAKVAEEAMADAQRLKEGRKPIPPASGALPPPSELYGALGALGLLQPARIAPEDAPTIWTWGKEALRVPGLIQTVMDREKEAGAFLKAAQRAQRATEDALAAGKGYEAALGASNAAMTDLRAVVAYQKGLVRPWGAGIVIGTGGEKGVVVQRDISVFRVGGEVTFRPVAIGTSWDARAQFIYRW